MEKSESISSLIKATIKVMAEVKGIDKTMTIGTGNSSYKGVSDQEVKKVLGEAMERNGLAMYPIDIQETTQLDSWDEKTDWGVKRKQNIFTKVTATYLLCHESGEYITLKGYGHGVDSQDKSAGKATTYALKYALLYTFLIPTGKIDDADNTHSEDIKSPQKQAPAPKVEKVKPVLTDEKFAAAVKFLKDGKTMTDLKSHYTIDQEMEFKLDLAFNG